MVYKFSAVKSVNDPHERRRKLAALFQVFKNTSANGQQIPICYSFTQIEVNS